MDWLEQQYQEERNIVKRNAEERRREDAQARMEFWGDNAAELKKEHLAGKDTAEQLKKAHHHDTGIRPGASKPKSTGADWKAGMLLILAGILVIYTMVQSFLQEF